jgi:ribosomal protein S20
MDQAREAYSGVQKNIDKAVTKGILHKRTGARYKSRLGLSISKTVAS